MTPLRHLAASLLALSTACGDGAANGADASDAVERVDAREQGDAAVVPTGDASASDGPPTIVFGGTLFRQGTDVFILGAEVCLVGQPTTGCELTDSVGRFRFVVPAESNQAVTIGAPGFASVVAAFRSGKSDLTGYTIGLRTETDARSYYTAAGAEWPSTAKGSLYVFARDMAGATLAGLRVALSPSSGSGPLYDDVVGAADKALQATSPAGNTHFAGIGPGEVDVIFGPSDLLCSATFGGWPSKNQDAVRIPVVAGFETVLGVRCF